MSKAGKSADTAILYFIFNAKPSLSQISFDGFMIKRVFVEVTRGLPTIKMAAMLLPTPGSRNWLEGLIETEGQSVFTSAEQRALKGMARIRSDKGDGMLTLLASTCGTVTIK